MGNICFSATKNCYASLWSYGEICVGCNCCGRSGKGLKMWKARLGFHKEELKRQIDFNDWVPEYKELQQRVRKSNITYHKTKIKHCEERIKHFESIRTESRQLV